LIIPYYLEMWKIYSFIKKKDENWREKWRLNRGDEKWTYQNLWFFKTLKIKILIHHTLQNIDSYLSIYYLKMLKKLRQVENKDFGWVIVNSWHIRRKVWLVYLLHWNVKNINDIRQDSK